MLIRGPHQRSCKSPGLCHGAQIKAAPWAAEGPRGQGRGLRLGSPPCPDRHRGIRELLWVWGQPPAHFLVQFCGKTWKGFWGALPPPTPLPELSHQDTNGPGHFIPGQTLWVLCLASMGRQIPNIQVPPGSQNSEVTGDIPAPTSTLCPQNAHYFNLNQGKIKHKK